MILMVKQVLAFDLGLTLGIKDKFPTLGYFISHLLFNVYAIMGVIFFILIIVGGWGMIMGAGSGDSGKVQESGKALGAAIVGFVFIFFSYLIVRVIEEITGANILNPTF